MTCPSGSLPNRLAQCIPIKHESQSFGGTGGSSKKFECATDEYITHINVGYDNKVHELKYVYFGCSDGVEYKWGRQSPSNVGAIFASLATMGMLNIPGSSYDNRTWADPGRPGWDKVALQLACSECGGGKKGTRVRSFGHDRDFMFGAMESRSGKRTVPDSEKVEFRCDSKGEAPVGKKWVLSGIKASTGTAVDSMAFTCKLLDETKL
jgi:hypothetical protein